jgi:hypothetical protein
MKAATLPELWYLIACASASALRSAHSASSRRENDPRHEGAALLLAPAVAGDRQGRVGAAVEAVGQRNEFVAARVMLGQAHGPFDRFGARVCEKALL